jgi:hypothetical protein
MSENEPETFYGMQIFRENPWMAELNPKTRTKREGTTDKSFLVTNKEGEIAGVGQFFQMKEVEEAQFVKWYIDGMREHAKLNGAGVKVFELLYKAVRDNPGKDQVDLTFRLMTEAQRQKMSYATYKRGIEELKAKNFIAQMPATGRFWINPHYMWNGDRLQFVKEYRRASNERLTNDKTRAQPTTITQNPVDPNQIDLEEALEQRKNDESHAK